MFEMDVDMGIRGQTTYLVVGRMQQSQMIAGDDVDEIVTLNVSYLNEVLVERENVRVTECKRVRRAFPQNLPVAPFPPPARVNEQRALAVVRQEQPVMYPVEPDRPHRLPPVYHVERRVA